DSIVLLYRPDGSRQWQSIDYVFQGTNTFGRMTVDEVMNGDYVLGVWDEEHATTNEIYNDSNINVYPNPTKGEVNIEHKNDFEGKIIITNQLGQVVKELTSENENTTFNLTEELPSGIYHLNIFNKDEKIFSTKLVLE
ncbi:MAG: T9SS type A sorting domain-containing protein, partial [Bacteroidales bacterium]|nr:T9SS type A sorting domain-containing protein [Bacteroidales bacterium]